MPTMAAAFLMTANGLPLLGTGLRRVEGSEQPWLSARAAIVDLANH